MINDEHRATCWMNIKEAYENGEIELGDGEVTADE